MIYEGGIFKTSIYYAVFGIFLVYFLTVVRFLDQNSIGLGTVEISPPILCDRSRRPVNRFGLPDTFLVPTHRERSI